MLIALLLTAAFSAGACLGIVIGAACIGGRAYDITSERAFADIEGAGR